MHLLDLPIDLKSHHINRTPLQEHLSHQLKAYKDLYYIDIEQKHNVRCAYGVNIVKFVLKKCCLYDVLFFVLRNEFIS